jgi:radical SAM protein with 4Fe4S-binding SPASM domain
MQSIAAADALPFWSYIATGGVMPSEHARWLARHFSLIGLSCDGPPDVQDAQRPTMSGAPTSAIVERTAAVLADEGAARQIRVTVTPSSVDRLCDIVDYACDRLQIRSIRLEPAYTARREGAGGFRPDDADRFVDRFLAAASHAHARGCELALSGVRPHEIHGPYCNPLRQTLQLTPDGRATACFLNTGSADSIEAELAIGAYDGAAAAFHIQREQAARLQRRAARVPARCEQCANVYHCARDCPDVCVITEDAGEQREPGFRCRVQKRLGVEAILAMACAARV